MFDGPSFAFLAEAGVLLPDEGEEGAVGDLQLLVDDDGVEVGPGLAEGHVPDRRLQPPSQRLLRLRAAPCIIKLLDLLSSFESIFFFKTFLFQTPWSLCHLRGGSGAPPGWAGSRTHSWPGCPSP